MRKKKQLCSVWRIFGFVVLLVPASLPADGLYTGTLSDAHGHLRPGVKGGWVIKQMDQNDVDIMIMMGRAGVKDKDVLKISKKHPGRVIPAIGMQNNGWRTQSRSFMKKTEKKAKSGKFQWIGEASIRTKINGKLNLAPDDKAIHKIFELSGKYGLPITLHHNTFDKGEVDTFLKTLGQHPGATVIWAHFCGLGKPKLIEGWLKTYPNLNCDLAWLHKHQGDLPVPVVGDDGQFLPEWKALIEAHPDRFFAGIDASKKGHYKKKYGKWTNKFRVALGGLSPAVAKKVGTENLHRLLEEKP